MIIFNEQEFVENILKTNKVPNNVGVKKLIRYLCQYYYSTSELKPAAFNKMILEKLKEFKMPYWKYEEFRFINIVKNTARKVRNGELDSHLFVISEVFITVPEMEIIQKADSENGKKLMLTYYVLAKAQRKPSGWVNYKDSEIFKRADVRITEDERCDLIYELQKAKLITLHPHVDNESVKVNFVDGEVCMIITNFEHIGNAYIDRYREGWKMCEHCGKLIHVGKAKTPGQPRKYCKDCAIKVDNQKRVERRKLESNCPIYSN